MHPLFRKLFYHPKAATHPDVTIIIPIYNKEKYLRQCLASVLREKRCFIEVILIDDGCSDKSKNIIGKYASLDSRIRLILHESNLGASYARNAGLNHSRGKYVMFVDADDVLSPSAIFYLYEFVSRNKLDAARGSLRMLIKNGHQYQSIDHSDPAQKIVVEKIGRFKDLPELWKPTFHVTYIFKRNLLIKRNIVYPHLWPGEDPVFLAKVLTSSSLLGLTPEASYYYRQHSDRPPLQITNLVDYIEHLRLVGVEYTKYPDAWDCYSKMVFNEISHYITSLELGGCDSGDIELLRKRLIIAMRQ